MSDVCRRQSELLTILRRVATRFFGAICSRLTFDCTANPQEFPNWIRCMDGNVGETDRVRQTQCSPRLWLLCLRVWIALEACWVRRRVVGGNAAV